MWHATAHDADCYYPGSLISLSWNSGLACFRTQARELLLIVLGWHGHPQLTEVDDSRSFGHHDAAAVLLRDGELVAAIEEERLNRVKHSNFFPARAIRFCLDRAGVTLQDVDIVITDMSEPYQDFILLREFALDPRRPRDSIKSLIARTFAAEFGLDISAKLQFCRHHMAHLYGTWIPSGFSAALVACLDGGGDGSSGLIAWCADGEYRILRTLPETLSLGNYYLRQIAFLGYQLFDEYKVMGLAPYGNPGRFSGLFDKMYQLQSEGRYSLLPELDRLMLLKEQGLAQRARRKGEPFTQEHKDFAAGLQASLERIATHVLAHFQQVTGAKCLCLSGGVAHNCSMNGKLLASGRFEHIYVQPAAHDAGNALGAALSVLPIVNPTSEPRMSHVYLGSDVGNAEDVGSALNRWLPVIHIKRLDDAPRFAAHLLAAGNVVGWVQGRSEFGPRALGNRSILADPRPPENKDIINSMVKKREGYRPFAPSVLEDRLRDFFEVPNGQTRFPFMNVTLRVRPEMRAVLGAITHVDGSARVQTVSPSENQSFYTLIAQFGALTGIPIVLNTSFNNHAEPIVESVDDAVTALLTTRIHALIVGDWLVERSDCSGSEWLLPLAATLLPSKKLVQRAGRHGTTEYSIESNAGRYFVEPVTPVSVQMHAVLARGNGDSLGEACNDIDVVGGPTTPLQAICQEALELWTNRAIQMLPVGAG